VRKVAYNACYGGFALSPKASNLLNKIKGYKPEDDKYIKPEYGHVYHLDRHDEDLIIVIEELRETGGNPSGCCSDIQIAEVDDKYFIDKYDGIETVIEPEDNEWINTKG